MSKTLGQVAFEVVSSADKWELLSSSTRAIYERTAAAVRDAVLAEHRAEVERLNAECCRLSGELAAAKVAPRESEWTERDGIHVLTVLRPAEVAALCVEPAFVGWMAGQHGGRVIGTGPETLTLAKHLAEVAAGVRS